MRDRHQSTGDLISTVCFAGVGIWLLAEFAAMPALSLKSLLIGLSGGVSLLAAFRYPIQRLVNAFWH